MTKKIFFLDELRIMRRSAFICAVDGVVYDVLIAAWQVETHR